MKTITYNNAAVNLHFEFPESWDAVNISSVSLTVSDKAGNELIAASNLTLYTSTTLDSDVSRFFGSVTLDSGASSLVDGDRILIGGVVGAETQAVKAFDATTKICELEGILENEHEVGDSVIGLFGDISIDVSSTTVFSAGKELVLLWTPAGTGDNAITELAQVGITSLDITGLSSRFKIIYPRAYDAFRKPVDNMSAIIEEARSQIGNELLARNLDVNRVVDQAMIAPVLMSKMAYLWCINGDIDKEDEREVYLKEYDRQFSLLTALPLWVDTDQDLKEDESEVSDHEHYFTKGW